jgi:hypothetical protein
MTDLHAQSWNSDGEKIIQNKEAELILLEIYSLRPAKPSEHSNLDPKRD